VEFFYVFVSGGCDGWVLVVGFGVAFVVAVAEWGGVGWGWG